MYYSFYLNDKQELFKIKPLGQNFEMAIYRFREDVKAFKGLFPVESDSKFRTVFPTFEMRFINTKNKGATKGHKPKKSIEREYMRISALYD